MRPSAVDTLRLVSEFPAEPAAAAADRYEDLGLVAIGGMGEVRRVRDRVLDRIVVMKVLRADLADRTFLTEQFVREARMTARLQHPSIVGLYDLGRLGDGRVYFTMREVHGHTLTDLVTALHSHSTDGTWGATRQGFTLRRAVDILHTVALTVAFAHENGAIHGDLKPDNIMVGEYGEVSLLDWGLAGLAELETLRGGHGVSGTPAYMAPEQAFAEPRTTASDVYGLGATLYHILAGHPPFPDVNPHEALRRLRRGDLPAPLEGVSEGPLLRRTDAPSHPPGPPPVPAALAQVVGRALARQSAARYPSARALADELYAWLDGSRRSDDARALVSSVAAAIGSVRELRDRAAVTRARAKAKLAELPRSAPDAEKRAAWRLQDDAEELLREADVRDAEVEGILRAALSLAPTLPEAHAALARRARLAHAEAEVQGDPRALARLEGELRIHSRALPRSHPLRVELSAYLRGYGELSLATSPAGVPVQVHRYLAVDRRLATSPILALPSTPIVEARLPMGSFLLQIEGPAGTVAYPVKLDRCGSWDGVPPGQDAPLPIPLDVGLEATACYVPAGWTLLGGEPGTETRPRRVWVDGFVIDRHPVTVAAYVAFLDDLVARGRADLAERHVPRERSGTGAGRPRFAIDAATQRHVPVPDEEGDTLAADWPVVLVDWSDASAFARWRSERTGLSWRLPSEWEWEKAARGVDGRAYPWGDHEEDTWACTLYAHTGRALLASVDAYPTDVSPYGVRGCAGNVHEWCAEPREGALPGEGQAAVLPGPAEAAVRVVRGGAWNGPLRHGACALRHGAPVGSRMPFLGFRLARSV